MAKVSVIVPVYNGEAHLRECMDSICGQTLQDIEIICVDDGSTDDSYNILCEYQRNDNRIQLYRQNNLYAGVARNLGMSHATGEYLVFWDCDDYFDLQALEKLYVKMRQVDADVGVHGCNEYLESKGKAFSHTASLIMKRVPQEEVFNRYTNPDYYLNFTNAVAWGKIFKRSYIEKLGLNFQPRRNANDVYFTINALGLADRITYLNEPLVTYRIDRENGLVSSVSSVPLDPMNAWIDTAESLEQYDGFGERSFANIAVANMIYTLSRMKTWDAFHELVEALQEYGLQKLHIFQREEGYYYTKWNSECVEHFYTDTPEEFAVFFAYNRYIQHYEVSAELRSVRNDLNKSKEKEKELKKEVTDLKSHQDQLQSSYDKQRDEIARIRNSWTFKVGKAVTWIPRRLKKLLSNG